MDRTLRCEEMAEIIFLPVRHHSPACSYHLTKMIEKYNPSMILIEGPENENNKIADMIHEETKAPFAVYYSYNDKKGLLSEDKKQYKCYYPFLDFSPEFVALREANKRGIPAQFIDLCYRDILLACQEGQGLLKDVEQHNYNDDYLISRSDYIKKLVEKTGLRSFDELWEKYFEVNGLKYESEDWFDKLLTYCDLTRSNTSEEELSIEGTLKREEHMALRIYEKLKEIGNIQSTDSFSKKCEEDNKTCEERKIIFVVTGGFHTSALKNRVNELHLKDGNSEKTNSLDKKSKIKFPPVTQDDNQASYLVAYSMKAADALNGYASGMPYSSFYQSVWDEIVLGNETPYSKACFDYIVNVGKAARKKGLALSVYDEICAQSMITPLSMLRGKNEPGAYELYDVVLSSYIKGENNMANSEPLTILREQMTGLGKGSLCAQSDVPPILNDFEALCKKYRIDSTAMINTEVVFQIFAKKLHREKSIFFHRLLFLNTGFVTFMKGPNLNNGTDRNLIREIWKYKWTINLQTILIDVSVYGGTIEEACQGIIRERMQKATNATDFVTLMTQAFVMGLASELDRMFAYANNIITSDDDFYSLAKCFQRLIELKDLQALYQTEFPIDDLIELLMRKLFIKLPDMVSVNDNNVTFVMEAMKSLFQYTKGIRYKVESHYMDMFIDILNVLYKSNEISAGLFGCVAGLLYTAGQIDIDMLRHDTDSFLKGSQKMMLENAQFFRGLFFSAKDVVFICEDFLNILKEFIETIDAEDFMNILPELRLAFAGFTPGEIDRIAQRVAAWYKTDALSVMFGQSIDTRWIAYGSKIDALLAESITKRETK